VRDDHVERWALFPGTSDLAPRTSPMKVAALLHAAVFLAVGASPEASQWLRIADETRNAFDEAVITARASQIVNGKVTEVTDFEVYTKGRDRGVIVFRSGRNSGRKVLTDGPRMWLLIPGASRPIPVTPNQRLVGGASMADVASLRFASDYTASLLPKPETEGGKTFPVVELTAKSPVAPFPRVVMWWNESENLPYKAIFSLPSGMAAKEVTFTRFSRKSGRTVATEMEIRDLLSKDPNTVTRLEYLDYRPAKLDDALFTPEGARGL
jgi:hypothetical protein